MKFVILQAGNRTMLIEEGEYKDCGMPPRCYFRGSPADAKVAGTITAEGDTQHLGAEYKSCG